METKTEKLVRQIKIFAFDTRIAKRHVDGYDFVKKDDYELIVHEEVIEIYYYPKKWHNGNRWRAHGWYVIAPCSFLGAAVSYDFTGPFISEAAAVDGALNEATRNGWSQDKDKIIAEGNKALSWRIEAKRARKAMTIESAEQQLIEAGVFKPGWKISPKVWRKSKTKCRIQQALWGDPQSIGLCRRDAIKN